MRYLVKMRFGSAIYGTELPNSDSDVKAIHMPDMYDFILRKPNKNFDSKISKANGIDFESFSLQQYVKLLCQGQTIALDMLFTPRNFWIEATSEWEYIVKNKEKFISKRIYPFVGYCRSQAATYSIKGTRIKEAKQALELMSKFYELCPNERVSYVFEDFKGLASKSKHIKITEKKSKSGHIEEFISVCEKEIPKNSTLKFAKGMLENLVNTYGKRTIQTETDDYDTKALYHAFRVAHEAIELLETGKLIFPRPERKLLLKIRNKELSYDSLQSMLDELLNRIDEAMISTELPDSPDLEFADNLIYWTYKAEILHT